MIYFTSDWHLNETRLGDLNPFFRPFASVKEQNEIIIGNFNRQVTKNDHFYFLGDLAMNLEGIKLLDQIKCKNRTLILGNYDEAYQDVLSHYFDEVYNGLEIDLQGVKMYLNHYPRNRKKRFFNIVGHIHGLWKVQRNMLNVSVDAWHFKPVSEHEILYTKNAIENYYDDNVFIETI